MKLSKENLLLLLVYGVTIALAYIGIQWLVASFTPTQGLVSVDGQLVGRDFIFFYESSRIALAGEARELFLNRLIHAITSANIPEMGDETTTTWPFLYPPHYLLLVLPLALFPYDLALLLWSFISVILPAIMFYFFWKIRGIFLMVAVLNVSIFYCLTMGQNSAIFAAIAGIGIATITKHPLISGICFAIISMKPHFAVFIPVALLLGKYYPALFYTVIITIFLIFVSSFLFGWDIWLLAIQHFSSTKDYALSSDRWFFSIYSTYRALLSVGINDSYAWIGQSLISAITLYFFQNIWRKDYNLTVKSLAFGITALLCTPYNLAYDSVWLIFPVIVLFYEIISKRSYTMDITICSLLALQIFAFAFISLSNVFSFIIISGAVVILFLLNKRKYENN